tara:strand:- start:172 stop:414 length:243 start_codon:yes stop_codon:yes gene_type:complete
MKKVMLKRYRDSMKDNNKHSMQTRSKANRIKMEVIEVAEKKSRYTEVAEKKSRYTKDEIKNGIIICMGGPYSERWFPPSN